MSSVPGGRALPFPIRWERVRATDSAPAHTGELSDEQAIAHLLAGDSSALHVLVDRYSRLVLHVALPIVRDLGERIGGG